MKEFFNAQVPRFKRARIDVIEKGCLERDCVREREAYFRCREIISHPRATKEEVEKAERDYWLIKNSCECYARRLNIQFRSSTSRVKPAYYGYDESGIAFEIKG